MKSDKQGVEIDRGLKLIVKSSMIVFIGLFLSKLLTYIYKIIIARYYGPEVYGIFSLAFMIVTLFVAFSSFGFADGLVRYISLFRGKKDINKIKYFLKESLIITIISGIISGIILFLLSEFIAVTLFHNSNLIIFLKIFAFLVPFYMLANIFLGVLLGYERVSDYSFISNIFQNLAKVVLIIIFIFIGLKNEAIIFSYFIGVFSMFLIGYYICKYKLPEIFVKSDLNDKEKIKLKREFFSYSWPVLFLSVINFIFSWTDSFLIAYYKDVFSVGLYNAAFSIAALMGFVPELFRQIFLPLITKEYSKKNFEVIKQLSKQSAKWIFMLNLPVFLILFLFPGAIINILFGPDFISSYNVLRILAVAGIFSSFALLLTNMILMTGRSKIILWNLLVFSALNIILNVMLIPTMGINGAALATTISIILMNLILFIEVKHYTGLIPLKSKMINIFLISFIPTIIVIILREVIKNSTMNVVFTGVFFFLLYFCLLLLSNSFDKNDLMVLKTIKNKFIKT